MLFRISSIFALVFCLFIVYGYSQTKDKNLVIAHFDDQKITLEDFEKAYAKSGSGSEDVEKDSLSQLKDFLPLYVEYRMKLEDGKDRGFESDPDITKEMNTYRDQIAYKLYIDKYLIEPNIKDLYEKRKWEYRVSHILFRTVRNDTSDALRLANAILDSLKNGADFSEMAAKYSSDVRSKNKGGDIYYFTAGQMPLNIENAVIETPPGQFYPKVLRSNYGYHIIKVTEKHKNVYKIRVSHILIRYTFDGKPDTARAKAIIDTVYRKLKNGDNFDKLVHQYSMDEGSAVKNGDIGFISRRQTVIPFDEAAFNLKKVGDTSGIVKTQFGYHIIKLTDKEAYPSFDKDKDELLKVFKRGQYYQEFDKLIDSLITRYNLVENKSLVNYISSITDTSVHGFNIESLPDSIKNSILYTLPDKKVTLNDFLQMASNQKTGANVKNLGFAFKITFERIAGTYLIIKDAEKRLQNDSSFVALMNDYKNGLIIFKLQQDEIWNKLKPDSSALLEYYTKNTDKYKWPDRVQFTELFTKKDSLIQKYQNMINNGDNFDTLCAKYTERPGYKKSRGCWALRDKNSNNLYQLAWKMEHPGQFSNIIKNSNGYSIIRLDKKDSTRTKTFEEAKAEVSNDYHEMRTEQLKNAYTEKLNKKFKPVIYYQKFENFFKKK